MDKPIPAAIALLLGLALHAPAPLAAGKPLYRWVDAQGKVHYGDKVPPADARGEVKTLDDTGRVRTTRERERTPEELRAAEAAAVQAQAEDKRRQQEAAHDKSLLVTYETVEQLEHARDEQLSLLDQRLDIARKSVVEHEQALARVQVPKPSPAQQPQITSATQALAEVRANVESLLTQRQATERKFTDDIARFRALRPPPG